MVIEFLYINIKIEMIIDKEIEIIVSNQQIEYYKKLGYEVIYKKPFFINPLHLPKHSHYKLNVSCDICRIEKIVQFRTLKNNQWFCGKCSAKNKKKTDWNEEKIKKMNEKMKLSFDLKLLNNPDYWKDQLEKIRHTKNIKYNDPNFNNQNKKRETLKEIYDDEHYNNTDKRKETQNEKYGNPNFNNQNKKEETCLLKYGVRHTNHVPEIMNKIQKSSKRLKHHNETNLSYRGTYEMDFLDFCYKNNIKVSKPVKIEYILNNKKHIYFPDFYHMESNTIIEIKSNYTFKCNLKINLLKMEYTIKNGYNFLFIIDKNYDGFLNQISEQIFF